MTGKAVSIRQWRPDDAADLHEMIESSLDHLRPWMAWATTGTVEARAALIESWARAADDGSEYVFAIVADDRFVGSCGLHRRSATDVLEIGYWVRADSTGSGLATAAVGALVALAEEMDGITHVEICHDADNPASGRVAEKAGFTKVAEHRRPPMAPAESGREIIWRLGLTAI